MKRIIINYDDDMSAENAIQYVESVMNLGRISNDGKCYCYVTSFNDSKVVFAEQTPKGTDTFRVEDREKNE